MADNSQKKFFARSLNDFAQGKALDAIQILGKALPASVVAVAGSIVTVKFEVVSGFTLPQVTCPMFGPEWIRYPTQVGDLGIVIPADAYIGGVSGLGGGIADLTLPANLSALVWLPIANANWSSTEDPNALVMYGPNGGILRTRDKHKTITVNADGITIVVDDGSPITVSTTGTATVNAKDVVVHASHSSSSDVNGYGSRTTFMGGSAFTTDNYVIGAIVTSVDHAWVPPSLPPP